MEEQKRFIGMDKNVVLGLSWILFPFAIVALAVDHAKMNKEDKVDFVCPLVLEGAYMVVAIIFGIIKAIFLAIANSAGGIDAVNIIFALIELVIAIPVLVFAIIAIVHAFKGEHYEMPIVYGIAKSFVKDDADASKEETNEANQTTTENTEVVEEEKAE